MKRLAPLLLVVVALAIPAAALADGSTPPAPHGHPIATMRLEILRLRIQLAHLRYRVVCHDRTSAACTQFTQKLVDRLTTLDKNVQAKLAQDNCSATSTDKRCTILSKVDAKIQKVIANLGSPAPSSTGDESGLDQAANALGGLNG